VHRLVQPLWRFLTKLASVLVAQLIVAAILLGFAFFNTQLRAALLGAAVGTFISIGVVILARLWEYRKEDHSLLCSTQIMHLEEGGRRVTFRREDRVRSIHRSGLSRYALWFGWSGQSSLGERASYRPLEAQGGYTVDHRCSSRPGQDVFEFDFEPVLYFRSRRVGIRFSLHEPDLTYKKAISYTAWSRYSPLCKLTLMLTWDPDTVNMDIRSVQMREYRTHLDVDLRKISPLRKVPHRRLKRVPDGYEWSIRAPKPNRHYLLSFSCEPLSLNRPALGGQPASALLGSDQSGQA
jgi:hypothetical protein